MKQGIVVGLKLCVWLLGLYCSSYVRFQSLYVICSGFYLILTNLGHRNVFNTNFMRPSGSFDADTFMKGYSSVNYDGLKLSPEEEQRIEVINEYSKNISKYANKECYCGSTRKYKKCCHLLQQKQTKPK